MKNKQPQTGSAHLVIIIILAIGLIGALGFVFWQNVIQKKTDVQDRVVTTKTEPTIPAATTKQEVALSEIAADDLVGTNIAVKYPKTWIMTQKNESLMDGNAPVYFKKYTIKNPDGKIGIEFNITNAGSGGTCDPMDGYTITQLDKSEITGYPQATFVSYSDDKGTFFAGIQNNNEKTKSVKIGDSSCAVTSFGGMSGVVSATSDKKTVNTASLHLQITFTDIKHDGLPASNDAFRSTIKTDDFKTAKRIVESLFINK